MALCEKCATRLTPPGPHDLTQLVEMNVFNPGLRPPSGYRFTSPEGVLFDGNSIEQVAQRVRLYRKRAKMPKGDPVREINDQLCAKHPKMCRQVADAKMLASRVVDSTLDFLDEEAMRQSVTLEERDRRVEICAACPHKSKWLGQCSPCNDKLNKLIPQAAEYHKTPISPAPEKLVGFGCDIVGDDLSLAVTFMQPKNSRVPEACWRKGPA